MSEAHLDRGTPSPALALGVLLTLYALAYLDRQVLSLLVDPIRHDLEISDFQVSLLQGASFVLFFTVFGLPVGWAVDRFSRRRIIFGGVMIWSLASAAGGLAHSYWQLMLCRFATGAGEAALAPAAYSLLADLVSRQRLAGAMAIFSVGAAIGGALSLILGGYVVLLATHATHAGGALLGAFHPWQLVFLMVGLPGTLLAFLVFLVREPERIRSDAPLPDARAWATQLTGHRRFYLCHILGYSLLNLMAAGYINWAPTMLIRRWNLPVSDVGLLLGSMSLIGGAAGMLGSGYLVDFWFRRGRHDAHLRFQAIATILTGISGATAAFAPSFAIAIGAMALLHVLIPFIAVAAAGLQLGTPAALRGRTSALFLFVYNVVGYGLGPSIIAGISTHLAPQTGNIAAGIGIDFLIFTPFAALLFLLGMAPMRRAVEANR